MKVNLFISQPMAGKTDAEIKRERKHLIEVAVPLIVDDYGEECEIEVIDSFVKDAPDNATPLWYLGESIKALANADVAIFSNDWQTARGCRIEHKAAILYDIDVIESYSDVDGD